MKFSEAMIKLESGSKVTRKAWVGSLYFVMEYGHVKSYQPQLAAYNYDEDIMVSDKWVILGEEGEYKFYDIIEFLQRGLKARRKDWSKDTYIYYDYSQKSLIIYQMNLFPYSVDFASFIAEDWVEI